MPSHAFATDDRPNDLARDGQHHAESDGLIPCEQCGDACRPEDLSQGWCSDCWESAGATIQEGGQPVWPERAKALAGNAAGSAVAK